MDDKTILLECKDCGEVFLGDDLCDGYRCPICEGVIMPFIYKHDIASIREIETNINTGSKVFEQQKKLIDKAKENGSIRNYISDKKIDKDPEEEKKGPGRPKTINREYTKSSQEGLQENWTRATFIVREDLLEKLKDLAYTNRTTIKEEINGALEEYLRAEPLLKLHNLKSIEEYAKEKPSLGLKPRHISINTTEVEEKLDEIEEQIDRINDKAAMSTEIVAIKEMAEIIKDTIRMLVYKE